MKQITNYGRPLKVMTVVDLVSRVEKNLHKHQELEKQRGVFFVVGTLS
jgi:hypothetical protein